MIDQSPLLESPSDEPLSKRTDRVARAKAVFDGIRADYPPQTSVVAALNEVRLAARYRKTGAACGGAMLIAPPGTGKTEAIAQLSAHAATNAAEGHKPVLRVEINTSGTTDSVPSSILQALGAARPDLGNEKARWLRAIADMKRVGVELIVFDEFNRAARRPTMSRPIATSIRERIMDAGVAAVAFVGSEDAATVLRQCPELVERLDDQIDLSPLDPLVCQDRELVTSFLTDIDSQLVELGILAVSSGLGAHDVAMALCEASSGTIRRLVKILRLAMSSAVRQNAPAITRADLALAVNDYALARRFTDGNPFR